jgi:geranyl-CoA carboxylase alpha subunit
LRAFTTVLVANRGEIACRILRTVHQRGYRSVAIFSDADRNAPHVALADTAVCVGPGPASRSYLNLERLLAAARESGADAIHPGYGFWSEKADYIVAFKAAGLTVIGPDAQAVRLMGDKAQAKRQMTAAGVPCVPGYHGEDQRDERFTNEAMRVGYPLMVKAAAGGGGKGMRLVSHSGDLAAALGGARSEARNSFGDDALILERAIVDARHVEVQVFGDQFGNVLHLGERDCSVQRRHQKVIEEAPSPAVDAQLRQRMCAAAVLAAKSIEYVGAGTIEFLLAPDGEFYFLEMNTRLQVEHPVTEFVTGLDLVGMQLDVAAGKPLPLTQEQLGVRGHAIEARLYAEDPGSGFMPQTGVIRHWQPATADFVRTDAGVASGTEVSPFYDPMLAKIIAWGVDREEARRRLLRAIETTSVIGVQTNKDFLIDALAAPAFVSGNATTSFIERTYPSGFVQDSKPPLEIVALAAALIAQKYGDGWASSRWLAYNITLICGVADTYRTCAQRAGGIWRLSLDASATIEIALLDCGPDFVDYRIGSTRNRARLHSFGTDFYIETSARSWLFSDATFDVSGEESRAADGTLRAPMSGVVTQISVSAGDPVVKRQAIITMEAMKMEHRILAAFPGTVEAVKVSVGMQVSSGQSLAVISRGEAG